MYTDSSPLVLIREQVASVASENLISLLPVMECVKLCLRWDKKNVQHEMMQEGE